MTFNFECKTCHDHFDSDVGKITFDEDPPKFEKKPFCKNCGERTVDEAKEKLQALGAKVSGSVSSKTS